MKPSTRTRYHRLARQLVIHGKRLAGSDEDFIGGIKKPAVMGEHDMIVVYNWMTSTPNRWRFIARAYCRTEQGEEYVEEVEAETQQAVLINSLSAWRLQLLEQAKAGANPRHLVAEGFEFRLAGRG